MLGLAVVAVLTVAGTSSCTQAKELAWCGEFRDVLDARPKNHDEARAWVRAVGKVHESAPDRFRDAAPEEREAVVRDICGDEIAGRLSDDDLDAEGSELSDAAAATLPARPAINTSRAFVGGRVVLDVASGLCPNASVRAVLSDDDGVPLVDLKSAAVTDDDGGVRLELDIPDDAPVGMYSLSARTLVEPDPDADWSGCEEARSGTFRIRAR